MPILTLLSAPENTLSSKCSLKCNWTVSASWARVGPFEQLFGCGIECFGSDVRVQLEIGVLGVQQEIGSQGRLSLLGLVWGATFSCALEFGAVLALLHSTQLLLLHIFLFLFFFFF